MNVAELTPRQLAYASLIGWAGYASHGEWCCPPHLYLLAQKLSDAALNPDRHLIVSMPPQHGKSELTSKYFPAWYLGRFPRRRVILASYGAEYAEEWGGKVRDLLREHGPDVFGVRVRRDVDARNLWALEGMAASFQASGVGGSLMGRGANLLLIDDPVKGIEEALSEVHRRKTAAWFGTTAYPRLQPGGSVVIVMTRWHESDLAGHVLANSLSRGGAKWEVISLPALAEKNDPLGRAPGEALWPQRYSAEDLHRRRYAAGMTEYEWSALYQQRPSPESGLHLKREWLRYYTEPSDGQYVLGGKSTVGRHNLVTYATVDLATSEKAGADYTVIAVWGRDHLGRVLLLDLLRAQVQAPDIVKLMNAAVHKWSLSSIYVETSGFQLSILQTALRAGLPARELKAKGNKLARFLPAIAAFEGERVWLPAHASWLSVYESELLGFPTTAHDDQVDVTSYAVHVADQPEWSAVDASPPSATLTTSRPSIRPTLGGRS